MRLRALLPISDVTPHRGSFRFRRMPRVIAAFLAAFAVFLLMSVASPASATTTDFVIYGRGYGHGAGMSQWGAWEGAREGHTYEEILEFYYPGASLTEAPAGSTIKVRISRDPASSSYEDSFYRVYLKPTVTAARLVLQKSGSADVNVDLTVGQVVETRYTTSSGHVYVPGRGTYDRAFVVPDSDTGRVAVSMQVSSTATATTYREYWGRMGVEPMSGGALYLHNYVPLDKYARGVAEIMPEWAKSSYPSLYAIEAVKAQAVAARTYAYAEYTYSGYVNDDTRDICYKGYAYELANPGAAQAAADTGSNILKYSGVLHKTFFSAHSGGYTSATAWNDDPPSYVVSKPDRWSLVAPPAGLTSIAPGYAWTVTVSAADLGTKLIGKGYIDNVGTITKVEVIGRDTSDAWSHATLLRITGTSGSDTISARNFRYALGLRSTLFSVNQPLPDPGTVQYQQRDQKITYLGHWISSGDGTFYWAYEQGAVVVISFQGTSLELYGKTAPRYGIAQVSVDGGEAVDWDFYSPTDKPSQPIGSTGDLDEGSHLVTIRLKGEKNAASTGYVIDLDSLLIDGTLTQAPRPAQQTDSKITYLGHWLSSSDRTFYWAYEEGAAAVISFQGTSVDLYAKKAPRYGMAELTLDDEEPILADLYASTDTTDQLVYRWSSLPGGTHTLTIRYSGEKNPLSTGYIIDLDCVYAEGGLIEAPKPIQQTDSKITYLGHWLSSSDRTFYWAYEEGAAAVISFQGTSLDFHAKKAPRYGIAEVTVDDKDPVDWDFYSPVDIPDQLIGSTGDLDEGSHLVTIRLKGEKNAASTGYVIDLDSLHIDGSLTQAPEPIQQTDPRITYAGHWLSSSDRTFYWAYEEGAVAVVSFQGTSLDLYAKKAPRYGMAEVTMDEDDPFLVDFYANSDKPDQLIKRWSSLPGGSHTLTIRYSGEKNPLSTGYIIDLDCLYAGAPVD